MAAENNADRSIVVRRTFAAPPALVFEAWTHPNHLRHWWGPNGFSITTKAFDFRPGGEWRLVMHGPDGHDYENRVTFDEIVPGKRLVYHHGGREDEPVPFSTTVTFEAEGDKTLLTMTLLFPTAAALERVRVEYGAEEGAHQTIGRLGEYVSEWRTDAGLAKSIDITRAVDAPRALVFAAFTEARHLREWWGPKGFTNPVCEIDARPGGAILIHMQADEGFSHPMTGTVHEVVPPERFVFTAVARDADGHVLLESHTTVTLREEGEGTRIRIEARAKGFVDMARFMLAGMEAGWAQSLEKLDEHVTRSSSS